MNPVHANVHPQPTGGFRLLHPVERSVAGTLAVVAVACAGYVLFVQFSDASALQRAAGPEGTGLGSAGLLHAQAHTGRAWPEQQAARRAASAAVRVAQAAR